MQQIGVLIILMKKSFAYSSAVLWNKLSTNVKTSTTLSMFKML
jgi:hypothetical protein